MKTDIIIIGAGPTGLMAACQLARYGVNFIIVDRKSQPTAESRAMLITARSLEIYQQMGVSQTVIEQGKYIQNLSIFINGKEKVAFAIGKAGEGLTDFPDMQVFEQSRNEELLNGVLIEQDHPVWWNTEFISLHQQSDHVTVQLKRNGTNEAITINAKYLIACDGAKSKVRHLLNCKFEGGTYESRFFVADTRIKWTQPPNQVIAAPSKINFCAFFPMYGDDNYRVLGTIPKCFKNKEDFSFKDLETLIKTTTQIPLSFENVNWFATYQLHCRCTDRFKAGRCFLAGDAAHIHSPAGGQGMNTGLQDAYNLSWKLAMVLQNNAGEKLLDSYHLERYPFARWLLKFTDRIFALMTSSNWIISWLRTNLAPLLINKLVNKRATGVKLFKMFSQIWYAYRTSPLSLHTSKQKLQFKAGDRFPYVLTLIDNKLQSCYHLLTEPKFHLVIIGQEVNAEENNLNLSELKSIIKVIYLTSSKEWESLGIKQRLYILVRPDSYMAMVSDHLDQKIIQGYFDRLF
ncbi:FAD-dependent monooxygenase [Mucilaginibacter aquariorum]|uniref:FAD-dependent monooxygenase n=1 Tax=Mucilaginibacter aquariorum TaxID=2967225 RepID=A0ABT1T1D6_9SPHI|nr:FAD-dependent monooxygenase [Mucilaginibacter aquariorum]MCQ6958362.1 FAD-dependent monooxygenase [Mucilaginibacter aquariorum]